MRPLDRDVLRFIECVSLGLWIALMPFVLAGGIYEIVTGSPSDGFLFILMFFAVPWFAFMMIVVPQGCWNHKRLRLCCRWLSLLLFFGLLMVWCLQF